MRSKRVVDVHVKLFLADSNVGLDHYCGGKVERSSKIQICVASASNYLVSSHATKAETFEDMRLLQMQYLGERNI